MSLGPNAIFIWASYGVVALVVAGVVAWLVVDGRRQQRLLDALEARGVTRRSAASTGAVSAAADAQGKLRG